MANKMVIEIVYAGEKTQVVRTLSVVLGTTLLQAIQQSEILKLNPEIGDIHALKKRAGIFGKLKSLNTVLKEGDRVEIYRSLVQDPMDARRARAKLMPKKAKIPQPKPVKKRRAYVKSVDQSKPD